MNWRFALLALVVFFGGARVEAAPPLAGLGTLNPLLFEVQLDKLPLTDSLTAYESSDDILLPLGELARLLTLGITVDPTTGAAFGFIVTQDRGFRADPSTGRVTLRSDTLGFDPAALRWIDDDLYVPSKLLAKWFPLDFKFTLNKLLLNVLPREKLPIQARLEREAAAKRLGNGGVIKPELGLPLLANPHELISAPFIDQTFGTTTRSGNGQNSTTWAYSAFITGDLAGMESAIYLSSTDAKPNPDARITLSRNDPDAGLLGPLNARSVKLGNVSAPALTNVMSGGGIGNGVVVSNRPLSQGSGFGLQTLRGDLPPGWDVTLYFNDALIAFQQSRADGLYIFQDLPLVYGENEFRLVFNGPLGQARVERQVVMLDQTIAKPGEFFYSVGGQGLKAGGNQSIAQFDMGLVDKVSATGGVVSLAERPLQNLPARHYANLGLRASVLDLLVNGDYVAGPNSSSLYEVGLRTKIGKFSTSLTHTQLSETFTSDFYQPSNDPIRNRDLLRLSGSVPLTDKVRLPIGLDFSQNTYRSGLKNVTATGRVSANVWGTSVTNSLSYSSDTSGQKTESAVIQLSRRVAGIGLSSQIAYNIKPETKLASVAISGDKQFSEALRVNASMLRVNGGATTVAAGVTRNFGSFGLSFSASHDSTGVSAVGVQLFIALGRDPQSGRWKADWQPMAGAGAISARAFLDANGNGRYDSGEEFVESAGFVLNNGSRSPMKTDASGLAYLSRLTPYQYTDVALDTGSLEDPSWMPTTPGVRVLPRPGKVQAIDFPVVMTGEVDGTVYVQDGGKKRGIGNALVELVDATGAVATSARSTSDGYYIIQAVRPGKYTARISPEQLDSLKMSAEGSRGIEVPANGDFVNGIDFVVRKK